MRGGANPLLIKTYLFHPGDVLLGGKQLRDSEEKKEKDSVREGDYRRGRTEGRGMPSLGRDTHQLLAGKGGSQDIRKMKWSP